MDVPGESQGECDEWAANPEASQLWAVTFVQDGGECCSKGTTDETGLCVIRASWWKILTPRTDVQSQRLE